MISIIFDFLSICLVSILLGFSLIRKNDSSGLLLSLKKLVGFGFVALSIILGLLEPWLCNSLKDYKNIILLNQHSEYLEALTIVDEGNKIDYHPSSILASFGRGVPFFINHDRLSPLATLKVVYRIDNEISINYIKLYKSDKNYYVAGYYRLNIFNQLKQVGIYKVPAPTNADL